MDILDLVHEDRSTAARPFVCNWAGCVKGFARKSDLVRHERIHTNERPWTCDWPGCRRDFIQRSALVVHTRTHTGERPHKCEYAGCDKAFSDSSSLARHRRIHTGKRPYMCAVRNCLKTFCRKTTLTKHIKKNHPQYSQTPDVVSLASFGPDTPQLGYTPSIGSSPPQTPSDNGEQDEYLPQPPNSYSYFPPQAGQQHPSYPSKPDLRSKAHLHPHASPGAWSADGRLEGYPDSQGGGAKAPPMSRSISQSSQSYLTPPPTHQTRFRSSRRQAAATRGRYKEYDQSEDEEDELLQEDQIKQDEDDEEYVEGSGEPVVGARQRRGAVAVGNSSRVSRRLHYQGQAPPSQPWQQQTSPQRQQHEEQERYEQHQHEQQQQQAQSYGFAPPPPPAAHHYIPSPVPSHHSEMMMSPPHEGFVSPPLHNLASYSMSASHTAPMPQYEFESHPHAHSPPLSFAAPPLRRASSFSALENASYPQQAQPYHLSSPGMLEGNPPAVGLGLSLGSPFTPELHERRLSEMHNTSLQTQGTGYSYEVFQDYSGPASAVTAPLPSPSTFAFPQSATTVRPSSVGHTPRRGSIGFPSLPSHIQGGVGSSHAGHAMYGNHPQTHPQSQKFESWVPPPQHRSTFSNMTSRLLEQEENGSTSESNGMTVSMSSY